jgi:protein arginine kinase
MAWYNEKSDAVVISSRVRLARNIDGLPFPHKMNEEQSSEVLKKCRKVYEDNLKDSFDWLDLGNMQEIERIKLTEKHLISPDFVKRPKGRVVILSKDESICVMINEEDHIRIQAICPGRNMQKAFEEASRIDDIFAKEIKYGYSEKYGYLTCCPTNVGTGMRASVMIHLPALTQNGYVQQLLSAMGRMGIAVRGMYGEGSNANGNIYQISNQVTLGISEGEIIKRLDKILDNIIGKEEAVRSKLFSERKAALEDKVWRAVGVLKNARIMSSNELLSLLSDVRIGADLGILKIDSDVLNRLIVETAPAHIAQLCGGETTAAERDYKRAELVRNEINI